MPRTPAALARFWALALGYVLQPPPAGFDSWPAYVESVGLPADEVERFAALIDPQGAGSRLLFQKVPEGKQAKNRIHLDVDVVAPITTGPKSSRTPSSCARQVPRSSRSVRTR